MYTWSEAHERSNPKDGRIFVHLRVFAKDFRGHDTVVGLSRNKVCEGTATVDPDLPFSSG